MGPSTTRRMPAAAASTLLRQAVEAFVAGEGAPADAAMMYRANPGVGARAEEVAVARAWLASGTPSAAARVNHGGRVRTLAPLPPSGVCWWEYAGEGGVWEPFPPAVSDALTVAAAAHGTQQPSHLPARFAPDGRVTLLPPSSPSSTSLEGAETAAAAAATDAAQARQTAAQMEWMTAALAAAAPPPFLVAAAAAAAEPADPPSASPSLSSASLAWALASPLSAGAGAAGRALTFGADALPPYFASIVDVPSRVQRCGSGSGATRAVRRVVITVMAGDLHKRCYNALGRRWMVRTFRLTPDGLFQVHDAPASAAAVTGVQKPRILFSELRAGGGSLQATTSLCRDGRGWPLTITLLSAPAGPSSASGCLQQRVVQEYLAATPQEAAAWAACINATAVGEYGAGSRRSTSFSDSDEDEYGGGGGHGGGGGEPAGRPSAAALAVALHDGIHLRSDEGGGGDPTAHPRSCCVANTGPPASLIPRLLHASPAAIPAPPPLLLLPLQRHTGRWDVRVPVGSSPLGTPALVPLSPPPADGYSSTGGDRDGGREYTAVADGAAEELGGPGAVVVEGCVRVQSRVHAAAFSLAVQRLSAGFRLSTVAGGNAGRRLVSGAAFLVARSTSHARAVLARGTLSDADVRRVRLTLPHAVAAFTAEAAQFWEGGSSGWPACASSLCVIVVLAVVDAPAGAASSHHLLASAPQSPAPKSLHHQLQQQSRAYLTPDHTMMQRGGRGGGGGGAATGGRRAAYTPPEWGTVAAELGGVEGLRGRDAWILIALPTHMVALRQLEPPAASAPA